MSDIRITIGGRLDRSVHDSFVEFKKLAKDAGDAADRAFGRRRTGYGFGGGGQNPELAAARAIHAEQSKLNRDIMRQQIVAARTADTQARQLARERAREELNAIRLRQKEERAAVREREREERRLASAATSLDRQRSGALYRQFNAREREIDRLATRTSHRATRFIFPRPEGAIGYATRTANDLMRGVGVDMSFGGGVSRSVARDSAAMGLSQQEMLGTGKTRGTEGWKKVSSDVANKLIVDPEQVTELMRSLTGLTGDFDMAATEAERLASMTLASGANMSEMGKASGYVFNQLKGMPDAAKLTLDVMRNIVGQTAVGAVEMEEYAKQMGRIAANAKMFAGSVPENIKQLSALAQLAAQEGGGTGGADVARALNAWAQGTSKGTNIKSFKKAGIELFEKGGTQKRPLMEIMEEAIVKTGGNIPKLTKLFPEVLGKKVVTPLANAFLAAGGGEAKTEEEKRKIFKSSSASKLDPFTKAYLSAEQEKANLEERKKTSENRAQAFQLKLDQITDSLTQKLLPALEQLAPQALKVANVFAKLVSWAAENPWKAAAAALSLAITRAFAESLFRGLIDRVVKTGVGGSVMAQGGAAFGLASGGFMRNAQGSILKNTTLGGSLAAAGTGLGLGLGVYSGIDFAGKSQYDEGVKTTNDISKNLANVHGKDLSQAILEAEAKLKKYQDAKGFLGGMGSDLMNMFGAGDEADVKGLEELINRKKNEYLNFTQNGGKLTREDQDNVAAQKMIAEREAKRAEVDAAAIGKATADGLKGQTIQVRVMNAADLKSNLSGNGPSVGDDGRGRNGK